MKPAAHLLITALLATFAFGAAAQQAQPDLAKGEAIANQVCIACHAVDGSRGLPANPILQGQHPAYLVKQLKEFKAGVRKNPIMEGFAAALSDEDMRNVSAFYATKQAKPGFATEKDLIGLGEQIYRGGIADRNIAACAGCHSPNGAGVPSQYPRLGGQHADYTDAQLKAFRNGANGVPEGARINSPQMNDIAAKMNDREIRAVADYIAGLR